MWSARDRGVDAHAHEEITMKIRKTTAWPARRFSRSHGDGGPAAADAVDGDVLIQAQDSPADLTPARPEAGPERRSEAGSQRIRSRIPVRIRSRTRARSRIPARSRIRARNRSPARSRIRARTRTSRGQVPGVQGPAGRAEAEAEAGDRGVPARTGDNDAACAAGGVVLISVAGGARCVVAKPEVGEFARDSVGDAGRE